ncbi:hypothetical protein E4U53_000004 [Claviceps sorghi]|nr:hypothetical protein E4U53_000004 [Claviceps sorghi]
MLFTPVFMALTAWQSFASGVVIERAEKAPETVSIETAEKAPETVSIETAEKAPETVAIEKAEKALELPCVYPEQISALSELLDQLQANTEVPKRIVLPAVPQELATRPHECVPKTLHEQYVDAVIRISKEHSMMDVFEDQTMTHAVNNRGLAVFDKRGRKCPEIRDHALNRMKDYSCDSAQNPDKCRYCSNTISFNMVLICLACAAKMSWESPLCCAAAASTFWSAYTQVCLYK